MVGYYDSLDNASLSDPQKFRLTESPGVLTTVLSLRDKAQSPDLMTRVDAAILMCLPTVYSPIKEREQRITLVLAIP